MPAHGLPTKNGVGPSCVGLPAGKWPTITDFLVERFPAITREVWLERMAHQLVMDEFGGLVTPERPYPGPMRIYYYRAVDVEVRIPFEEAVLYQDDHLVVADKPHFLPVTPSCHYLQETLLVRLQKRLGIDTLIPIHRIDRETAGLVVFCKQPAERKQYHALFKQQRVSKCYEAVAPYLEDLATSHVHRSRLEEDTRFFLSREVAGEPNSETRISLLRRLQHMALYQLEPVTGRRHQLRLHMLSLGIPIAGDQFYPTVKNGPHAQEDVGSPLQLLARRICYTDPVTGQLRDWRSQRQLQLAEEKQPV